MPSDSNGVYSLPSGYEAVTGETIQASQHNPPLEDLASSMSQRLMRSGAAPMTGPLKIADGSVGSPGLKFSTDGTTGVYKTPNGIGVAVGGTKVAEFTSSGVSRMLGELIAWTMLSAPSGWVLAYGQTLSRTTYADLWAAAQTEISNGNTFFNNGNGTTTFGIGDLRGRVVAGKDDMGGTSAARLNLIASTVLGTADGGQTTTIRRSDLPNVAPTFTGSAGVVSVTSVGSSFISGPIRDSNQGTQSGASFSMTSLQPNLVSSIAVDSNGVFTPTGTVQSLNGGVTQTGAQIIPPLLICNYILFAGA